MSKYESSKLLQFWNYFSSLIISIVYCKFLKAVFVWNCFFQNKTDYWQTPAIFFYSLSKFRPFHHLRQNPQKKHISIHQSGPRERTPPPLPSPSNTPHHHQTRNNIYRRLSGGLPIFCTCRNNTGTTVFRNSWHSRAVRMTHLSGPLQASDSGAPSHRWGVAARQDAPRRGTRLLIHPPCCSLSVSLGAAVSSSAARRDAVTSHHTARPNSGLNGRVALLPSWLIFRAHFGAKSVMSYCCWYY